MRTWQIAISTASAAVLFCFTSAGAAELSGKVVAVSDGDTITVLSNSLENRIRLADIDCPEKRQPFGQKAKSLCSELCFGKEVKVSYSKKDRYERIIGSVELPDGRNLNQELLKAGMAWCYTKYCNDETMVRLEKGARDARVGLWADSDAIPPWEWRNRSQGSTGTASKAE